MNMTTNSDFAKYLDSVDLAEKVLKPDSRIIARLRTPERFIRSYIWLQRDDGTFQKLWMGRCQFNHARGPTQGGTRMEEDAGEDTNLFLSSEMNNKNANVDIMHGGGKGVITVDPRKYSKLEVELFCRGYIDVLEPYIGPYVDGPAPDVNTGGDHMAFFEDELETIRGYHNTGAFTGKPIELGGSLGRDNATGLGAIYVTEKMVKHLGLEGKPLSCGIDGSGNAGMLYGRGVKKHLKETCNCDVSVRAISDRGPDPENKPFGGFIAVREGELDLIELEKFLYTNGKKTRKCYEYAKLHPEILTGEAAFEIYLHTDFGAPSANKNRITADMARVLTWKFAVELANGPCTLEAGKIVDERGIPFAPDNFASGGGVRVSSAEKSQGLANAKWTRKQVNDWLKDGMYDAFDNIVKVQEEYGLKSFRQAANIYAFKKIIGAMEKRGGLWRKYGETIDAMPVVVSATPSAPKVLLKQAEVILTNPAKVGTLLLRSIRRWIAPFTRH